MNKETYVMINKDVIVIFNENLQLITEPFKVGNFALIDNLIDFVEVDKNENSTPLLNLLQFDTKGAYYNVKSLIKTIKLKNKKLEFFLTSLLVKAYFNDIDLLKESFIFTIRTIESYTHTKLKRLSYYTSMPPGKLVGEEKYKATFIDDQLKLLDVNYNSTYFGKYI